MQVKRQIILDGVEIFPKGGRGEGGGTYQMNLPLFYKSATANEITDS